VPSTGSAVYRQRRCHGFTSEHSPAKPRARAACFGSMSAALWVSPDRLSGIGQQYSAGSVFTLVDAASRLTTPACTPKARSSRCLHRTGYWLKLRTSFGRLTAGCKRAPRPPEPATADRSPAHRNRCRRPPYPAYTIGPSRAAFSSGPWTPPFGGE
jgi:hypothetical protein